jgi:hypothetical protein
MMTMETQRINQPARQRWLTYARIVWVLVSLLTPALVLAGIPGRLELITRFADRRSLNVLGMNAGSYGLLTVILDFVFILGHYAIALVIFLRKKDDWLTLLVALGMVVNGALIPIALTYSQIVVSPIWLGLVHLVIYIGVVTSISLLYVFPDGRFVPVWTQGLAIAWALLCLPAIFTPDLPVSMASWPAPVQIAVHLFFSATGVYAQVHRYVHVSSPIQRQQAKWAIFGLIAAGLGPLAYFLPFVIFPSLGEQAIPNILYQRIGSSFFSFQYIVRLVNTAGFNLFTLIFPISFAIAILRYRLWDIDILINRALVYTVLSGTLLIVYLASVILLESILRALTGEGSNQLVTVLSTLAIAASFAPLRREVQNAIDRRFYRSHYNAARTVESFGEGLREEVDLNSLSARLVAVVEETMQPEQVSLWLRRGEKVVK